jgi:hypothetical protein
VQSGIKNISAPLGSKIPLILNSSSLIALHREEDMQQLDAADTQVAYFATPISRVVLSLSTRNIDICRDVILRRLAIFFLVSEFVKFNISLRIMKNKDD